MDNNLPASRKIEKVYMVSHRYDLLNLAVCIASIKYWYPSLPIVVINNKNNGDFDLEFLKQHYKVSFLHESDYDFGTFYGSLLPFISAKDQRFVIVDTDTAFTGKILDFIESVSEDFVIDYEIQPEFKIRALYWNPEQIGSYVSSYNTDWFTFNNGIIAATGGLISRADFSDFMNWEGSMAPEMKNKWVFPMHDQTAINVAVNKKFSAGEVSVRRHPIMIYPPFYEGSEAELLDGIINRNGDEFRVIHWADTKNIPLHHRPLGSVFSFYLERFLADFGPMEQFKMKTYLRYLGLEYKGRDFADRLIRKFKRSITSTPT